MPNRHQRPRTADLAVTTEDLIRRRKLWPTNEAAYLLGVARSTLYDWEREGLINFVKVGGRTFVADAELDRFVARAEARQ
jgi:excisionase family DNA binding protein